LEYNTDEESARRAGLFDDDTPHPGPLSPSPPERLPAPSPTPTQPSSLPAPPKTTARRPPRVGPGLPALLDHAMEKTRVIQGHDQTHGSSHTTAQPNPVPEASTSYHHPHQQTNQEKTAIAKKTMTLDFSSIATKAFPPPVKKFVELLHFLEGKCPPCWFIGLPYNHPLDNCTARRGNIDDQEYRKFRDMLTYEKGTCFRCLGYQVCLCIYIFTLPIINWTLYREKGSMTGPNLVGFASLETSQNPWYISFTR
jgi:hypothetical protein